MKTIEFKSDFNVVLEDFAGTDDDIARAARTSSGSAKQDGVEGLIKALMKGRHGTPFEHNFMKFRITAPLFIWREWHRHRIGFSYNEQSGRYMQLDPVFYVPSSERMDTCIKPEGFKPMKPGFAQFGPLTQEKRENYLFLLRSVYTGAYSAYERALEAGVDNGLARIVLPVAIYSTCYVTCNLRSALSFLSLRRDYEAYYNGHCSFSPEKPSYPLWEMDRVTQKFEYYVNARFPIAHKAFLSAGMVAP